MPLKFRPTGGHELIFCDDAGGFFRSSDAFLERFTPADCQSRSLRSLPREPLHLAIPIYAD
ncbi:MULTISPECIES: hypothetical protein [unclassified Rhizobium]|uniref:hypothetical protein n=1 Tax=unclassified Rhizobium TaxID=2613769 RepID=UPI001A9A1A18|nr:MULTISPECIES: hypothetical protein [unclassified Rhizobium]MBX5167456.1 hypothetical protein [Rhizobium sp. NZLR4b]MBX5198535.1 hypothetical protein [Rhizobium sp. NZLR10]MBX5204697.1 hypothetical protein [Rhizobium sp. NZLR1]MBX5210579.1 hypothetical protein [Rhizobium sp. NZLR11]QSZ24112.1 hypothetical protein J3O30_25055 [Rhizobium sp. NZLR1]